MSKYVDLHYLRRSVECARRNDWIACKHFWDVFWCLYAENIYGVGPVLRAEYHQLCAELYTLAGLN